MGTNYYVATNHCEHCNRFSEEYHIGKSSYGWSFTFRGYRHRDTLTSWSEWKEYLKDKIIIDEYGERMDYESFVDMIETWKAPDYVDPRGRKNLHHNDEIKKDTYSTFNPQYDWDDEQGYAFSSREFS